VADARRRARRADGGGGAHRALKNMGIWRGNEPPGRDSERAEGKVYRVHPVFTPIHPCARDTFVIVHHARCTLTALNARSSRREGRLVVLSD